MSNKLFDYFMAQLAVVGSDMPSLSRIESTRAVALCSEWLVIQTTSHTKSCNLFVNRNLFRRDGREEPTLSCCLRQRGARNEMICCAC